MFLDLIKASEDEIKTHIGLYLKLDFIFSHHRISNNIRLDPNKLSKEEKKIYDELLSKKFLYFYEGMLYPEQRFYKNMTTEIEFVICKDEYDEDL